MVYRKPSHTDLYLHVKPNHYTAQERAILLALIGQAKTISDPGSFEGERYHMRKYF
jgi:hypothetical protein